MFDRLKLMKKTYEEIQDKLIKGNLEVKEMTQLLKEASSLEDAVTKYTLYDNLSSELNSLNDLIKDEDDNDMIEVLKEEVKNIHINLNNIEQELKILLLPKDPNDNKNVLIEIKGAAGGDEGNIFAGDLFRMYQKYSDTMGWKIEILNASQGSSGGFASIEFMVSGKKAFSYLKHESGTHRVQRVPETESQGRVHTSTATVIVMPEAEEIDFELSWNDIRVDVFRASGAGGQHVNTTDSAVRLTHIPSGLVVASQMGKSQHDNKETAFKILKTRLYDKMLEEQLDKEAKARKELVGRGDRSEKVRTYNYPQNRVTDHRINLTINRLDAIIDGKLELVIEPLLNHYQKLQLEGSI